MLTGLILTDTKRVADLLAEKQSKVKNVIELYISECSSYINWVLVDVSDSMYNDVNKSDWLVCSNILNDYYYGLGLQETRNCPLFIIGGNDVIPMPLVDNPIWFGGTSLYSDMLYCFERKNDFSLENLIADKPRFAVGRFPIAEEYAIDTLQEYLADCAAFTKNGIHVRGAVMTTTESWFRASKEMMKDIPTTILSPDYVPLNERMVVSPLLDTSYEDMYDDYVHELKKVDFLVCNLHGSDDLDVPFFIGEDHSKKIHPVAIQPSMLQRTCPLIFNTVACFGARYMGYAMEDSMLLTAMAFGTILYCGACDSSLGGCDEEGNSVVGNSELMMKLYNIYLHKGMPAGLALLKAKQDYYRTCHNEDGDENAMFTILEFNLFGCPLLSMQPKIEENYRPTLLGNQIMEKQKVTYQPKSAKPIFNSAYLADDIHAYVRDLVDDNLRVIRQKVEKEVYQRLGLGKENLQRVYILSQTNYQMGYQFVYRRSSQESYRQIDLYYLVNTDTQGKITKIIHTK